MLKRGGDSPGAWPPEAVAARFLLWASQAFLPHGTAGICPPGADLDGMFCKIQETSTDETMPRLQKSFMSLLEPPGSRTCLEAQCQRMEEMLGEWQYCGQVSLYIRIKGDVT